MSETFWIAIGSQTLAILGVGLAAYINLITRLTRLETKMEMMIGAQRCGDKDTGAE